MIIRKNTSQLRSVDAVRDAKDMWDRVRDLTKHRTQEGTAPPGITAEILNNHCAAISTDVLYQPSRLKQSCQVQHDCIDEMHVFQMLDRLRSTATGLDQLPA